MGKLTQSGYAAGPSRKSAKTRMAHMAALRKEACKVPVPPSLVRASKDEDKEPKLALPSLAQEKHAGERTFWQVDTRMS